MSLVHLATIQQPASTLERIITNAGAVTDYINLHILDDEVLLSARSHNGMIHSCHRHHRDQFYQLRLQRDYATWASIPVQEFARWLPRIDTGALITVMFFGPRPEGPEDPGVATVAELRGSLERIIALPDPEENNQSVDLTPFSRFVGLDTYLTSDGRGTYPIRIRIPADHLSTFQRAVATEIEHDLFPLILQDDRLGISLHNGGIRLLPHTIEGPSVHHYYPPQLGDLLKQLCGTLTLLTHPDEQDLVLTGVPERGHLHHHIIKSVSVSLDHECRVEPWSA